MNFVELWNHCNVVYGCATEEEGEKIIFCPECEEPILEDDYRNDNLCPCCEFDFEKEE